MKHIVTSGTYTPVTRELLEAKPNRYKEEDGDLVDLLQSDIPNSYDRITLHKWDFKGEIKIIKGEYVIFDFDPKEKDKDIEDKLDEIIVALNKVVGLNRDHLTIIFTGRGYHVLVKTIYDIDRKFLEDTKKSYKEICKKLQKELDEEGVEVDDIFSKWHIRTRIPGRHNEKNNKEVKLIQVADHSYADDFLAIRTPEENKQAREQIAITDSGRVLSECEFISKYKARINKSYNEWLALGSILVKLPDGEKLVHDYSREDCDGGYSEEETNNKIPEFKKLHFRCETIGDLWDGCKECPHHRQIKSPTDLGRVHGSKLRSYDDKGNVTDFLKLDACVDALRKEKIKIFRDYSASGGGAIKSLHYLIQHPLISGDKQWKEGNFLDAGKLIHQMIKKDSPTQTTYKLAGARKPATVKEEIIERLYDEGHHDLFMKREDINPSGWYNFSNGTLNAKTMEFFEGDHDLPFNYVLDFEFDPTAEVHPTIRDDFYGAWHEGYEYQKIPLLKMVGVFLRGEAIQLEKFGILSGETRNGKSMFLYMIQSLLPKQLVSDLSMAQCTDETFNEALVGRVMNICDETTKKEDDTQRNRRGNKTVFDPDKMKQVISGSSMRCNPKHIRPFSFANRAGILISANGWPRLPNDPALIKRLAVFQFENDFSVETGKVHLPRNEMEKLILENRQGTFNWFLQHGMDCANDKYNLGLDERNTELVKEMASHQPPILEYIDQCIVEGDLNTPNKDWIGRAKIYSHYKDWCAEQGEKYPLSQTEFGKHLKSKLYKKGLVKKISNTIMFCVEIRDFERGIGM